MENLQPPFGDQISGPSNIHHESQDTHPMELQHRVTEDTEAVLSLLQYEQQHMNPEEPHPIRMNDSLRLDAENMVLITKTPAASQMKLVETSSQPLHSLPKLHENLEEYHQWFQPTFEDPGPSVCHPSNRLPEKQTLQTQSPPLNIKPATLITNINPSFANPYVMPYLNPSWPVLVPHLNPNIASGPPHISFCPICTPQLHFNLRFKPKFTSVACEDHSYSSLVLQPHLNVYPVCPTPNIYQPNVQMIRTNQHCSGRFPRDLRDSFRLWQRLRETARLFCSSSPDAEALGCFFMRVIPSLSVYRSDLPFNTAVNVAVQEWRNTSNFEREPYYSSARMFIEMEEQNKSTNRAEENPTIPQTDKSKGQCPPHSSGKLKKTGKTYKKVSVQDLAEDALNEYSQLMDALESKVTDGSEVAVDNDEEEEDVCALFLNQLLNDSESTTEAGFDIDFINSLLSTDVLEDNSQDAFSSIIPEPIAGCSDWTHTRVSEAQISPPSAVQHDFSHSDGTNLLSENNILEAFQNNVKGQNALLVNPKGQSSKTDPNTLIHETNHLELQDFGPEADGNQKDETLFVPKLDSAVQSNCSSLQNYDFHQATFTETIKHDLESAKPLIDGEMEHDGDENMEVGQETEKYMHVESAEDNDNMDLDIPNDSQRMRSVCNKQKTVDKIKENNANENKKHKRRCRRQKHQKMTLPVARTLTKSDHKDERKLKAAEYQTGKIQLKSTNPTKHEARAQETEVEELQQHMNITETTSLGRRGNLLKHDKKAERESGKTYGGDEGQHPEKQKNALEDRIKEDCGDFQCRADVRQPLRRKTQRKLKKRQMK